MLNPDLESRKEAPEGANDYGSKGYKHWINLFFSGKPAEIEGDEIRNSVTGLRERGERAAEEKIRVKTEAKVKM